MSAQTVLHVFWHGTKESLLLLPLLFLTYLFMEFLEHKAGDGVQKAVSKAGRMGPLLGGLLGLLPQCGFSAVAAGLYAARIVTPGTVLSVFLATSDEMIPVLLGAGIPAPRVLTILAIKLVIAVLCGFVADLLLCRRRVARSVSHFCEEEHCHCHEGVLRSALYHTLHVFLFVLIINLLLGGALELVGEQRLEALMQGAPVLSVLVATLVGLVPNCAASVAITTLYAKGILSAGAMLAGLLAGAGAGLLVLFRTNRPLRQNLFFVLSLLIIGVSAGALVSLSGLGAVLGL